MCLAQEPRPASVSPEAKARARWATRSGSSPKARVPMTGLAGSVDTSNTGARSRSMSPAARIAPSAWPVRRVSSVSSTAPSGQAVGRSGGPIQHRGRVQVGVAGGQARAQRMSGEAGRLGVGDLPERPGGGGGGAGGGLEPSDVPALLVDRHQAVLGAGVDGPGEPLG